ncbi:MAG: ATP-binding protein, partial [Gammaproteobacteria bacterium]|nr:ATP-binding protein [Gammaproteobacteria bacterium]
NDEVGGAGRAFNYLVHSLEKAARERDKAARAVMQSEKLASLGQLAAGIGHEINNPLQNILSLSDLIEKYLSDDKDKEIKEDIRLLKQEGRRCSRIVQGVLNFARESEISYKKFNLTEMMIDTLSLMKHRLEASSITLEKHIIPVEIEGDANLIQQVIVNLLINAIQASSENTTIKVFLEHVDDSVRIIVQDEGCGIPDENISEVFNPFFTSKKEGDGTGLGLSVSYGIINNHGGTIFLENILPHGIRATIVLPVKAVQSENEDKEIIEAVEVRHAG